MGKFFTLLIIFVLSSKLVAQENTTEHSIQKGESVYSISKRYGVSMNAIFNLNPGSETIIYAGRTLRIPSSSANNQASNSTVISESSISNYEVQRGDTKSGLARRFGVSIAMLEQQNPQITRMLQAGHIINLDKTIAEKARTTKEGEHFVVKGETLWGIARQNGISVAQLTSANEDNLSEFLQIGQTLIIPDKNSALINTNEYIVKRGDTKFALAKRFNMTIVELEEKNPQIIDLLMTGHILNIDNSSNNISIADTNTSEETKNSQENVSLPQEPSAIEGTITQADSVIPDVESSKNLYKNYVIEPQETLYSLSKKAGMSMEAFAELNPILRTSVNKGDIIKMPVDPSKQPVNSSVTNSSPSNTTKATKININEGLYSNLDTSATSGLYFYTPFSGQELSSPELRKQMLNSNDDYGKFLEFFQGAQIAIDSALALNLNFDITLIKESDVKSEFKIESDYRKNAILVPFLKNSGDYPKMVSNTNISIIDIASNISPIDGKTIYKTIPSENFQKTKTLNYIANKDAQIIVVSDLEEARNKALISKIIPEAKFLKVDNAGSFKANALESTLSKDKLNYIILDSEKTIVFLKSTTALMSKLSEYNIQMVLINSSLKPNQNEVSNMRYRVLKLIFPTMMNQNVSSTTMAFEKAYQNQFKSKPSKDAILGFDITLDVLLRLSQNSTFETTVNTISSEHSRLKFEYKKTNDTNYSNTGLYLMQYDSNDGMIILD